MFQDNNIFADFVDLFVYLFDKYFYLGTISGC